MQSVTVKIEETTGGFLIQAEGGNGATPPVKKTAVAGTKKQAASQAGKLVKALLEG